MRRAREVSVLVLSLLGLLFYAAPPSAAQVASMKYDGRRTVTLNDGTTVVALQALGSTPAKPQYYYLPANLHIASGPDGTPQFLCMKFTSEKPEAQGGISGGLLHFLMEFGLTPAQQSEVTAKLKQTEPQAELLGAAPVTPDGESGTFQITSATLMDNTLTKSLVTSGKVPLLPGQRVAAAARLTASGAQLLAATFEKTRSITDVSLSFNLAYYTLVPAVSATMTFHASKLQREYESLRVKYKDKQEGSWFWADHHYTYSESQRLYKFLQEQQIVEVNIDTRVDNEATNKIRDAFLQMFLDSMSQKQQATPEQVIDDPGRDKSDDKNPKAPAVKGDSYSMSRYSFTNIKEIKDRVWRFNASVPIRQVLPLTGNLATWYNQVRNNPKCIASINLNDPFFTYRDVRLILDLDAKEIFDEALNYVTVNVRKKRSSGQDFQDSVTIDAKFVKDNGVTASMVYARGEDRNPDTYEYQAQWSLKGGVLFPKNPPWQKGTWEGVTLAPPVRPRTLEVQCDPDELKAKDITRATVQVHYLQFGDEAEANVSVIPAKGEQIVSKKLFCDRDRTTYAYRVIYNHKTAGKLVGPWVKNVGDDYVYVAVPAELLTDEAYKTRGSASGSTIERVLDRTQ